MNWKQRIAVVSGNALDFYDIAIYAAIADYLVVIFQQNGIEQAGKFVWLIFALRFLIRPLGGLICGWYSDKKGRKATLILTSLISGGATCLMALLPIGSLGESVVVIFLLLQLLQGFSFGGEYPALIAFLLHDGKKQQYSVISSLIVVSSLVGVLVASRLVWVLSYLLTPDTMLAYGWRIPFLLGVANIGISLFFRLRLNEAKPTLMSANKKRQQFSRSALAIFVLTIPAAVVFYVQNIATGLLADALQFATLRTWYPLLSTAILIVIITGLAWLVDKYSTPEKAFTAGLCGLIVLAVPIYGLLGGDSLVWLLIAQLVLSMIIALILGNLAAVLWLKSDGKNLALATGYNLSLSIFGGISPLIINSLLPHGFLWAGLYVAVSAIPALGFLSLVANRKAISAD